MKYSIKETKEAIKDVARLADYMIHKFKNHKAAKDFIAKYDREAKALGYFPFGYRGINFEYRGYEIRIKPFSTYNIFFVVNKTDNSIIILRVLKNKQDWKNIFKEFSRSKTIKMSLLFCTSISCLQSCS